MRLLVCAPKVPYPPLDGESLRIYNISKRLSQNHDVYLFSFINPSDSQQNLNLLKESGIFRDCFYLNLPGRRLVRKLVDLSLPVPGLYWGLRYPRLAEQARTRIGEIIREKRIDIIQPHSAIMGLLLAHLSGIPKVLDLQDSITLLYKRKLQLSFNPADAYLFLRTMSWEKYLLSRFDLAIVVSPVDREYLRRLNGKANIRLVPVGVDTDLFRPVRNVEDFPSVAFSGVMDYDPNVDSALYIYKEILPAIRARLPEVRFYIAGRNPSPEIERLAENSRIIVTGYVEDLRQYILKASVVLAPMRKGTGIKTKILEAMALGKPVVTNPMGAEALDQDTQKCVAIGKTPAEMAEKVLKLLENRGLREETGRKASQMVRERYTWEICSRRYEEIYKSLSGEPDGYSRDAG